MSQAVLTEQLDSSDGGQYTLAARSSEDAGGSGRFPSGS